MALHEKDRVVARRDIHGEVPRRDPTVDRRLNLRLKTLSKVQMGIDVLVGAVARSDRATTGSATVGQPALTRIGRDRCGSCPRVCRYAGRPVHRSVEDVAAWIAGGPLTTRWPQG
jgi:hypothetical protein